MMNEKIVVVTGSSGFLSTNLITLLIKNNYFVIGIDLKKSKFEHKNFQFEKCNVANFKKLKQIFLKLKSVEILIHSLAIQPRNEKQNLNNYLNINLKSTSNILEILLHFNIKKLIFTSSFSVYGNQNKLPISEKAILKPQNNYGISKLLSEKLIYHYSKLYNIKTIILRFDGIFGFNQNLPGFIEMCIKNCQKNKNIDLFNMGKQIRDQVYVDDASNVVLNSIKKINRINFDIFNIGGGHKSSGLKIARIIKKLTKSKSIINLKKINNPHLKFNKYMSIKKAKTELNYKPKKIEFNINSFIKKMYEN